MSDNFGNKDYDSYFKALEQRANSPSNRIRFTERKSASEKPKKGIYKTFRLRKSVIALFVAAVILIGGICIAPSFKGKPRTADSKPENTDAEIPVLDEREEEKTRISFLSTDETDEIPASNDAKSAIVINKTKGTVVAQRNAHQRVFPASTTKVMTLLVAVEHITDFEDTYKMTYEVTDPLYVAEASVAGFSNDEDVTMTDLLYGMILPSGADGAMGLAMKLAGSEEKFAELMNEKVRELGLEDTHFSNVSGLHSEQNYSTAYDMAIILNAAMENETCRKILSTYKHTTRSTPQHPDGIDLSCTLFNYMYGTEPETAVIKGGKTGFVNESGYCIVTFGTANESNDEYIVATMGNSSRWPAFYGQIDLYKEFAK